jgi:hypothetical protein
MMAESHWEEANEATFAAAWTAELNEVPAFADSTIHMVAGLLLPIWKRLPNESTRVYRLQNRRWRTHHRPQGLASLGSRG